MFFCDLFLSVIEYSFINWDYIDHSLKIANWRNKV